MYRLLLIGFTLLVGCQQQLPPSAVALTDQMKQEIVVEVQQASDQMIQVARTLDGEGLTELLSDHPDFAFSSNGMRIATKAKDC